LILFWKIGRGGGVGFVKKKKTKRKKWGDGGGDL